MRSRSFWANGILGYIIIHRWAWWGRNVAKSWLVEEEEELKIEVWEKSERLGLRRTNHSTAILGNSRGRCGVLSSISTWLCQCNVYDDHDDKLPSSLHRCYYLENLCEDAPKCMPKNYNDTVTRPSHAMFYLLRYFNKYRLECSSAITYNGTRRAAQLITRKHRVSHSWMGFPELCGNSQDDEHVSNELSTPSRRSRSNAFHSNLLIQLQSPLSLRYAGV